MLFFFLPNPGLPNLYLVTNEVMKDPRLKETLSVNGRDYSQHSKNFTLLLRMDLWYILLIYFTTVFT